MKTSKKVSRETLPKTGLPRVYRIDKEIASGCFPNSDDLAQLCETSISTISRDIEFMRDQLRAPIEYDALNRGYYYTEERFRLPAGFTSAEDLLALSMAKSIFSLYKETPLFEASNNLLESILTPITSEENSDWLDKRILVPQTAAAKVDNIIWGNIISAVKQNHIINFYYQGIWDEEPQLRRVHPYQLIFDSGIWYLYGFSEERKATRLFSLSRISQTRVTKDIFTLPKNFSYTDSTSDSFFGVFIGHEKRTFVIDCYEEAAIFASERKWAADQKIIKNKDGITIEFSSTQYDKVLKWLLSCGCCAVPKKPKKLVDDWNWHILEMKKMAKKS